MREELSQSDSLHELLSRQGLLDVSGTVQHRCFLGTSCTSHDIDELAAESELIGREVTLADFLTLAEQEAIVPECSVVSREAV